MHIVSQVVFTRAERDIINDCYRSITVAYPDGEDREAQDPTRVLGGLAAGSPVSRDQLGRARTVLARQVGACREQSDVGFWVDKIPGGGQVTPQNPYRSSPVALVADPQRMAAVLAEARSVQLREAQDALELVDDALARLPELVAVD